VTTPQPRSELASALRTVLSPALSALLVFSLFINLLYLAPSLYMLQIYDRVLVSASVPTLVLLTVIIVGLLATLGALDGVRARVLARLGTRLDLALQERLLGALLAQALRQPGTASSQTVQDLAQLRQGLTGSGLLALLDLPWTPLYVAVLFLFHSWFGWAAVLSATLLALLAGVSERVGSQRLAEATRAEMAGTQRMSFALRNAETVAAMGMLPRVLERWREHHVPALRQQLEASDRVGLLTATSKVLRLLTQSLILGLGAWLTISNEMTAGMMIAGTILLGRALAPIDLLTSSWRGLMLARDAYARLGALLAKHPPEPEHLPLPAPAGRLAAERLVVSTPETGTAILKGVSLALERGELLGLIGPSGSGKSTLARALLGLMPLQSGVVRLDGADLAQWGRAALGPHLGYLPQGIELFDGTVAENIARFGPLDAEQVVAAARRARVHELILGLPEGYDTRLGPGGVRLSPGQQQRIALARAVYGEPVVIVLDEPNSNLDDEGESALIETLVELKEAARTVIVITHRPSLLQRADRIAVVQQGQLALIGPREQVIARLTQAVNPRPRLYAQSH